MQLFSRSKAAHTKHDFNIHDPEEIEGTNRYTCLNCGKSLTATFSQMMELPKELLYGCTGKTDGNKKD